MDQKERIELQTKLAQLLKVITSVETPHGRPAAGISELDAIRAAVGLNYTEEQPTYTHTVLVLSRHMRALHSKHYTQPLLAAVLHHMVICGNSYGLLAEDVAATLEQEDNEHADHLQHQYTVST